MAAPTPKEAAAHFANALAPCFEALALSPVSRVRNLSWYKTLGADTRLFVSVQADSKGTDPYSGGGLRLEFEKSSRRKPARGLNGRAKFFQLLQPAEESRLLRVQNEIISTLPAPPRHHLEGYPAFLHEQYLSDFQRQDAFTVKQCWLRFGTLDHIDAWAEEFGKLMPILLERAENAIDERALHLGQGSLLG